MMERNTWWGIASQLVRVCLLLRQPLMPSWELSSLDATPLKKMSSSARNHYLPTDPWRKVVIKDFKWLPTPWQVVNGTNFPWLITASKWVHVCSGHVMFPLYSTHSLALTSFPPSLLWCSPRQGGNGTIYGWTLNNHLFSALWGLMRLCSYHCPLQNKVSLTKTDISVNLWEET